MRKNFYLALTFFVFAICTVVSQSNNKNAFDSNFFNINAINLSNGTAAN